MENVLDPILFFEIFRTGFYYGISVFISFTSIKVITKIIKMGL